ncbi:response regulator transcription factor [Zunongwangia atlantica]|uniref:LuxR family transcriptional regulator protein n=1 Tax=Zunongwangia atlantica 22II14-10F7 TaxID=1185767 RepID=A0A1Y1SY65_9FLAO|nr:helix-turn-helix transcriptional regulator [Zunongwangia atlantica]ORL43716.1 LuxR family transcriptional regulator protein [Zunongwangia atlantica 22II14-10F7]
MTSITTPTAQIIAGINPNLPADIEFIPAGEGLKVSCLQGGRIYPFKELEAPLFMMVANKYNTDRGAKLFIKALRNKQGKQYSFPEQVEIYTFYMWGAVDGKPDIKNGVLQPSENFLTGGQCPSMDFDHKHIEVDGNIINSKDVKIIFMAAKDLPNKAIADELNISIRTLEYHLTRLYRKVGAFTRTGLVNAAYQHKILA